jgi:hypothetical protein
LINAFTRDDLGSFGYDKKSNRKRSDDNDDVVEERRKKKSIWKQTCPLIPMETKIFKNQL